jgi:hypothetical protein
MAPFLQRPEIYVQSTDHELIPARLASLAAIQGSASGSNVHYYPTRKHSPLKERNEQGCYNASKLPDVCSYAMIYCVSLSLINRKSSVHPSTCTLYTPPALH